MTMKTLVGVPEYQVYRSWADKDEFGFKAEIHVFERPEHAIFFLSQLEPVVIPESGKPSELRWISKVIRYRTEP